MFKMAKLIILLCFISTPLLDAFSLNRLDQSRIIKGSNAPDGLYPYQVSLQVNGSHNCGGSIISNNYILTAAHCLENYNLNHMKAVVGTTKLSDGGIKLTILEWHLHKEWNSTTIKNDIAVMKVEPITFSKKVFPIVLDATEILGETPCTITGWGLTSLNPTILPNHLQQLNLTTISNERCKNMHTAIEVDAQKEICTFTKFGEGVCSADSGGPLVRSVDGVRRQIGVVSWGVPCGVGFPDVFARVSSYMDWIKKTCNNCI